jgi:Protein of unknown function (DUF1524)
MRWGVAAAGLAMVASCGVTSSITSAVEVPMAAGAPSGIPTAVAPGTPGPTLAAAPSSPAAAGLANLPVKGRAPTTGYSRAQFGPAWADTDRNGCGQRDDVLARDLTGVTYKPARKPCVVLTGTLHDPYTGDTIAFTRGQGTSDEVQIDHVVALSDAWQTGAQQLDAQTREMIATDPLNLLAVKGVTNQSKGDGDAATWLPPAKSYRCAYVARQVAVKTRYRLWVTAAERDAIARVLSACPWQLLP